MLLGVATTHGVLRAQERVATGVPADRDTRALNELLARSVTFDVRRVSLKRAIDVLSVISKVPMQYEERSVDTYATPVTLHLKNVSLRVALDRLLAGTTLTVIADGPQRLAIIDAGAGGGARGEGRIASGVIQGTVTDAKTRRPLRGVMAILDDSVQRARTNEGGQYRFTNVAAGAHRISVRQLGYVRQLKSVTVADNETATADIAMESSVNTLDQVVVTATGEQRIRELGHVVVRVNVDSLVREAPITDIRELLQSRVPGLQVITGSGGIAGADMTLRLRGTSTFNLDPEPIVIVDGVRYRSNNLLSNQATVKVDRRGKGDLHSPLNDLNPNDIETIEVAKGPSASTLYGPDASNGVIVITTKHGKAGRPEFRWYARPVTNSVPKNVIGKSYRVYAHWPDGTVFPDNGCTLVSQYQYQFCFVDSIRLVPSIVDDDRYSVLAKDRTAWQYGTSLSGGSSALRYFGSTNVNSQTGILQVPPAAQEYLKRQLGTTTLKDAFRDPNKLKTISVRASLGADINAKSKASVVTSYVNTGHRRIEATQFSNQYLRGALAQGRDTTNVREFVDPTYIVWNTEDTDNRFNGSANATYQLLPWLSAEGNGGVDMGIATTHAFMQGKVQSQNQQAQASDNRREHTGRTFDAGLTANARPGIWSFRTSVRGQYVYDHIDGSDGSGFNLAPGSSTTNTAERQSFTQLWSEQVTLGTYGEEVIGLHDRLFLTGSLRYDGSTSFGDEYNPKPYPKFGVSWILSDEPMLQRSPLFSSVMHELRLRASYGAASRYPTTTMKIGSLDGYTSTLNGSSHVFFSQGLLANPGLKPERKQEGEIGLDATMLGNMTLGLTWYRDKILDQLQVLRANSVGLQPYWANQASTKSRGFEATLLIPLVDRRNVHADVNVAYSYNTSTVIGLGAIPEQKSALSGGYAIGYPLGAVFGEPIIDVTDSAKARGIVFDNEVIRDTLQFLGVLIPPRTLTFTPQLQLFGGRIRVSSLFDRQTGFLRSSYGCANGLCLDPYVASTPLLQQARFVQTGHAEDGLTPGDFTRWRELNITVDIPQRLLRPLRFGHASVSLQGRELALWTKPQYKGPDPESLTNVFGSNAAQSTGIPQTRAWSFRFDVTP